MAKAPAACGSKKPSPTFDLKTEFLFLKMKKRTETLIKAFQGFFLAKESVRKMIKRQLCSDPCFAYIYKKLSDDSTTLKTYSLLLEIVSARDLTELIHQAKSRKTLKDLLEYYFEGLDICRDLSDEKVNYLNDLLFDFSHHIYTFHCYYEKQQKELSAETEVQTEVPRRSEVADSGGEKYDEHTPEKMRRRTKYTVNSKKHCPRSPPAPRHRAL